MRTATTSLFVDREITDWMARCLIEELVSGKPPDVIIINSEGGSVTAAFAIADHISLYAPNAIAIATGRSSSAANIILAAINPKKRFTTRNTTFLLHPMSAWVSGKTNDVIAAADHVTLLAGQISEYLIERGYDKRIVMRAANEEVYLNAQAAAQAGIATVIHRMDALRGKEEK